MCEHTLLASALSTLFDTRLAAKIQLIFWYVLWECIQSHVNSDEVQLHSILPTCGVLVEPLTLMLINVVPGARGEGCHPWCHSGGGGEQDEGRACLQDSTESRERPLDEVCGRISHHTQHLRCESEWNTISKSVICSGSEAESVFMWLKTTEKPVKISKLWPSV